MKLNDTYLVSALMTKGFKPRERIVENKTVFFIFDEDAGVEEFIEQYQNNVLEVHALEFANMVRSIKVLIWDSLKSKKGK